MAKPKSNTVQKKLTIHPSVRDIVSEFAKEESDKAIKGENANIKNVAVICVKYSDFRVYKVTNDSLGNNQNFIHVSKVSDLENIQWHDHVKLDTRFKMPNVSEIIKAVENNINQLN